MYCRTEYSQCTVGIVRPCRRYSPEASSNNTIFKKYAGISKRSQRGGLENRLPKRHGGSNPSSCATLALENPVFSRVFHMFLTLFLRKEVIEPKGVFARMVRLAHEKYCFLMNYQKNSKSRNPLIHKTF